MPPEAKVGLLFSSRPPAGDFSGRPVLSLHGITRSSLYSVLSDVAQPDA